jgi:hypothetical protein
MAGRLSSQTAPNGATATLYRYFRWKAARKAAWTQPREIALKRLARAERIGLTYEEYTLEILERGSHLQPEDAERIAAITRKRKP